MEPTCHIHGLEHLKLLGDERRLEILRLLMARPATLSQLGETLGEHPARVRHHLKLLEGAGLVELVETRIVRGFVEKYYRASAGAFIFNSIILPTDPKHAGLIISGSHDLALDALIQQVLLENPNLDILAVPVGSLDGLIALRQGTAQAAACHLFDSQSGEYNIPFIHHLLPDRQVNVITLVYREQGLIIAPGNPCQIRGLLDLVRPELRFVNRNRGSGTRLWLDLQIRRLGIPPALIQGYAIELNTHTAVAEAIQRGTGDLGLGLRAAAQNHGLDFIPLFQERFDLVIPQEYMENTALLTLLEYLHVGKFRLLVNRLAGYDPAHAGDQVFLN